MAQKDLDVDIELDRRSLEQFAEGAARRLKEEGEKGLLRLGIDVQNRARQKAPVDTGRLRASISHELGSDGRGPYVDVGSNVEYAPHVEYGTSRMSAKPYLRPAIAEAVAAFAKGSAAPVEGD